MRPAPMTPQAFIAKWKRTALSERAASHEHFLDLCRLLGHPAPAEDDPDGDSYTFERGVKKSSGSRGWADVWKRGYFAWEYKGKGKHKDLGEAYRQLLLYREDLENPPILVVSDISRYQIHTNFTGTAKQVYEIGLEGIADPGNLEVLRKVFTDPYALKPGVTAEAITKEVADRFARLAEGIRRRGVPMDRAAHFLMKLMFCMFAEDIELLPEKVFTKTLTGCRGKSARLTSMLRELFGRMATGGDFGPDPILYFNGGLFADADTVELTDDEINVLIDINKCDWGNVEPSIFGTLFERTIDPDKLNQVGRHYTSREDIETLLQPVLMAPLRQEWEGIKERCEEVCAEIRKSVKQSGPSGTRRRSILQKKRNTLLLEFIQRISRITVLDPACGSGNFLYVAIRLLLALETEVIAYAADRGTGALPFCSPRQLFGIETNRYAQELAQVVIWIGHLQWKHQHGFAPEVNPVLASVESIQCADALLDVSELDDVKEPAWPEVDVIVGNPPFLGDKKMRGQLGDNYVDALRRVYRNRLPGQADLCCYWFEKARAEVEAGRCQRAGFIATQGIRGGANRACLDRVKRTGSIFWAYSDLNWTLNGATVHVSMVAFDNGTELLRQLNGVQVRTINADLTSTVDLTAAQRLACNAGLSFIGATKKAPLDVDEDVALGWLRAPNPARVLNSDVVRPWMNGLHVTRRIAPRWIVDFPIGCDERAAGLFEHPFEYAAKHVRPLRIGHREAVQAKYWWRQARPCPEFQAKTRTLSRYICTPRVSKHRVYTWVDPVVVPDCQLVAFPFEDYYHFGILHSRVHAVWVLARGTQVRERESGFRYTPTTCFETFPFPRPAAGQRKVIAEAATDLDRFRNDWLNPPEWTRVEVLEFPGSAEGPWRRYVHSLDKRGIGTVRYPRLVPKDEACVKELAARTLTKLYNKRPAWLVNAHRELDDAVFAAYDWKPGMSDEAILGGLLELNLAGDAEATSPSPVETSVAAPES